MRPNRKFWAVYTFDLEFVLEGVFTKRADAEALAVEINPAWESSDSDRVYLVEQNLRHIVDVVLKERLGKLYEPLKAIAGSKDEESAYD